jgi:1,4-alpha-glucan branching enzyme
MRLPLRPSVVMAAAVIGVSCAATMTPGAPVVTPAGVRFEFVDPEARSVAVAGTFNRWSATSHPLSRARTGGTWSMVVALPPGEHLFMYVVDDTQWITPPVAEDYVDDGFGASNGVVVVRPNEP